MLLGRGTEDVKVDIDLGREARARASKISRRQVYTETNLHEIIRLVNMKRDLMIKLWLETSQPHMIVNLLCYQLDIDFLLL